MPRVSVIIPVLNQSESLKKAIDSTLGQTFRDLEVIVVADGSIKNLSPVVEQYSNHPKFHFIKKPHGGVASAMNAGILRARGEYICWLSSDNYFMPYKVAHQLKCFEESPGLGVVFTDAYIINDYSGIVISVWESPHDPSLPISLALFAPSFIMRSTAMISRECFEKIELFNEDLKYSPELEWWFKAAERYEFKHLNYPTAKLLRSSVDKKTNPLLLQEESRIIAQSLTLPQVGKAIGERLPVSGGLVPVADALIQRKLFNFARTLLSKALESSPSSFDAYQGLGRCHLSEGNYSLAVEAFEKAARIDPESCEIHYFLGRSLDRAENLEGAIQEYRRAISLGAAHSADLYNSLAMALSRKGNREEAEETFRRSLDDGLPVKEPELLLEAALFCFERKNYEISLKLLERLNEIDEEKREAYLYRGLCHFHLGNYQQSAAMYVQALNRGLQTPQILDHFASSLDKMGWGPYAETMWKMALQKDPGYLPARTNYAEYLTGSTRKKRKPLNMAFVLPEFAGRESFEGRSKYTYPYKIARALVENGHSLWIFCAEANPSRSEFSVISEGCDGITVSRVNLPNRKPFQELENKPLNEIFKAWLRYHSFDLVHFHHTFFLSLDLPSVAKELGLPCFLSLYDFWNICPRINLINPKQGGVSPLPLDLERCASCLEDLAQPKGKDEMITFLKKRLSVTAEIFAKIDAVFCPSEFVRRVFQDGQGIQGNYLVMPPGIQQFDILPGAVREREKVRFGYIGDSHSLKDLPTLLKAFKSLSSHAELFIYGKIQEDARNLMKLSPEIENLKLVDKEAQQSELPLIFSEVDVLIIPSFMESFCIEAREAFMSKVPVIASRAGDLPEIVEPGVSGFLFEPGNEKELAEKMKAFLDDPWLLRRMRASLPRVISLEENALQLEEKYLEILAKRGESGKGITDGADGTRLRIQKYERNEAALADLPEALQGSAQGCETYFQLGRIAKMRGLFQEALNFWEKVVDLQPRHKEAWCQIGYLLMEHKEVQLARGSFLKALEVDSSYEPARRALEELS